MWLGRSTPVQELARSHFHRRMQAVHWQQYAEVELAVGNTDAVKGIFGRCLLHNLQVDLWRVYVRFIKQARTPHAMATFQPLPLATGRAALHQN